MEKNDKIDEIFDLELSNNRYLKGHINRLKESFYFLEKHLKNDQKIIDVGSYGHFTKLLSKIYTSSFDLTNFELRDEFPIESEKYDMSLCMEVIEHLKDKDSNNLEYISSFRHTGILNLLCEINRILKNGGILFLTTPNLSTYLSILKILRYDNPYFFSPHPRELSINELKTLLTKTGFEILEIETKNVWNEYSIDSERHSKFISDIKKFSEENGFSDELRGDDIFIIAKKVKKPLKTLIENEYFSVTLDDIYPQQNPFN